MKTISNTLGVSRSNLYEQSTGATRPRRRPLISQDAALLRRLRRHIDERPTYGYRCITALLRRELAVEGLPLVNHKRVYRLMQMHGLLLTRHSGRRPGRIHDGKVIVMASNRRWCSDALEFTWGGMVK